MRCRAMETTAISGPVRASPRFRACWPGCAPVAGPLGARAGVACAYRQPDVRPAANRPIACEKRASLGNRLHHLCNSNSLLRKTVALLIGDDRAASVTQAHTGNRCRQPGCSRLSGRMSGRRFGPPIFDTHRTPCLPPVNTQVDLAKVGGQWQTRRNRQSPQMRPMQRQQGARCTATARTPAGALRKSRRRAHGAAVLAGVHRVRDPRRPAVHRPAATTTA
jgi:hypothetical protein